MILCAGVDSGDEGVESGEGSFSAARAVLSGSAGGRASVLFPPAKSVIFLSGLGGSTPTDVTGRESSLRREGAIAREGVGRGVVSTVFSIQAFSCKWPQ